MDENVERRVREAVDQLEIALARKDDESFRLAAVMVAWMVTHQRLDVEFESRVGVQKVALERWQASRDLPKGEERAKVLRGCLKYCKEVHQRLMDRAETQKKLAGTRVVRVGFSSPREATEAAKLLMDIHEWMLGASSDVKRWHRLLLNVVAFLGERHVLEQLAVISEGPGVLEGWIRHPDISKLTRAEQPAVPVREQVVKTLQRYLTARILLTSGTGFTVWQAAFDACLRILSVQEMDQVLRETGAPLVASLSYPKLSEGKESDRSKIPSDELRNSMSRVLLERVRSKVK